MRFRLIQKGFFSSFVFLFSILVLITVLYNQTNTFNSQLELEKTLLAQQQVSKDLQLAKIAFSKFASDAIAYRIDTSAGGSLGPGNCAIPGIDGYHFEPDIATYWNSTQLYMFNNFGADCRMGLRNCASDYNAAWAAIWDPFYIGDLNTYCVLCRRKIGQDYDETSQYLKAPLTIMKEVEFDTDNSTYCRVKIQDGIPSPPYDEIVLDYST